MDLNTFIRSVQLDEQKRIIISVQDKYIPYLQMEKARKMIKKSIVERLAPDFERLEFGPKGLRITVVKGTEEKNLEKVNKELMKGLNLALRFLLFK